MSRKCLWLNCIENHLTIKIIYICVGHCGFTSILKITYLSLHNPGQYKRQMLLLLFYKEKKNEALKFHNLPKFAELVNGSGLTGSDAF